MKGCEEEKGGLKVLNESRGEVASLPYLIDYIGQKSLNCVHTSLATRMLLPLPLLFQL